jgi:leucyl-tRNA synthetase
MDSEAAKAAIVNHLKKQGVGDTTINFKLKDWCVSRQRYWGAPIPIIYCEKCGIVPVPEKDLPVELPKNVELTGEGGSPLAKVESFVKCKCPKCKGKARRETDTMDTFVESSWYFLRYCSPKYNKGPVDPDAAKYWMPVDQYIGGIEHAVGHLLYCRFYMKVMRDLGFLKFSESNEPVKKLLTQGMVTLGGSAMSKSKGNIVEPDEIIQKYGADTARLFILFAAPPEKDLEWNNQGVEGCWRFLNRVWRIVEQNGESKATDSEESKRWLHKTIKRVTEDIERFHFNTAISAIMEYVNFLYTLTPTQTLPPRGGGQGEGDVNPIETLVLLISPFAPHMAEELWKNLGHKDGIIKAAWPKYDSNLIQESKMMIIVQVNGKLRDKLEIDASANEDAVKMAAQELEKIKTFIGGKPAKKVIYVPGKLVNIVI